MHGSLRPHAGDLVALDPHDCARRLEAAAWARVAFLDADGAPRIYPVSHLVVDGAVVFRTSPGALLGAAAAGQRVAVQVDGGDLAERTGWSVLATGTATMITDADELERLYSLPFAPWAEPGQKLAWVRVPIDELTGRAITGHR